MGLFVFAQCGIVLPFVFKVLCWCSVVFVFSFSSLNQLHKDIEAKDEQITKLRCENEELHDLAQHVQYMVDMIEVVTLVLRVCVAF